MLKRLRFGCNDRVCHHQWFCDVRCACVGWNWLPAICLASGRKRNHLICASRWLSCLKNSIRQPRKLIWSVCSVRTPHAVTIYRFFFIYCLSPGERDKSLEKRLVELPFVAVDWAAKGFNLAIRSFQFLFFFWESSFECSEPTTWTCRQWKWIYMWICARCIQSIAAQIMQNRECWNDEWEWSE